MGKKLNLTGLVLQGGKLSKFNAAAIKEWLLNHQNEIISIELKLNKKRSNPQNRYYWGVVLPLIQQGINNLGNEFTIDDTHDYLKAEFNTKDVIIVDELKTIPQSTANLTTEEFNTYIEKCVRFAAEMIGIIIPEPNEPLNVITATYDPTIKATIIE